MQELRADIVDVMTTSVSAMDDALKKVYDIIGGLPHYTTLEQQVRGAIMLQPYLPERHELTISGIVHTIGVL